MQYGYLAAPAAHAATKFIKLGSVSSDDSVGVDCTLQCVCQGHRRTVQIVE